jgi:hypothetical protein
MPGGSSSQAKSSGEVARHAETGSPTADILAESPPGAERVAQAPFHGPERDAGFGAHGP